MISRFCAVGVAIVGSFIFCCVNEYIRKRNADNLMEEFRLMNEAAAANNANASIESDITDFGDLAIADAARPQVGVVPRACGGGNAQREWLGCTPCHWMTARLLLATFFKGLYHATCHNPGNQVAANLAANVGVDAEAFLNNETIRQDLAADEDRTGGCDAIRLQGVVVIIRAGVMRFGFGGCGEPYWLV